MINLEWLRTFRVVYKTKSLSKASELLYISQPTVSQHIRSLEGYLNKKLFVRKSKGVLETDEGKILNTMVSGTIESLEEIENKIGQKYLKENRIISIGISSHLFQTVLGDVLQSIGSQVHVKFGKKQELTRQVEDGDLLFAIVPDVIDTLDMHVFPLVDQQMVIAYTPDIDLENIHKIYKKDTHAAEKILTDQTWYAHDATSNFLKVYWMHVFDKRRPAIVPNYIIPNEFELLQILPKGSGMTIAFDSHVKNFEEQGHLKTCTLGDVNFRSLMLVSSKKKAPKELTEKIRLILKSKLEF